MLTNLFSMFDPTIHYFNPVLYVLTTIFLIMIVNTEYFITNSNLCASFSLFMKTLKKELYNEISTMDKKSKKIKKIGASKMFFFLLMAIFFINFFSLFPYVISVTSHISFNLPMAISIWLCVVIISLILNWKNFFAHLTPSGTPIALMSFMVLIETISNIIRPLTLSVRLMANMVAGHLLLLLLSKFLMLSVFNIISSSVIMAVLGLLEMGVSIIQAYVFVLLCVLYAKEAF